ATSERCTSAPHVTMTRSVPSWRSEAFPNGIMKSLPGYSPLLYVWRYRCLCSRNITGSSQRIDVRNKPAASMAVEGYAMRIPGQCAKMLSPDWLWYGPPPRRYPPIGTRMTIGHVYVLPDRYRSIDISSRSCIIAGQM